MNNNHSSKQWMITIVVFRNSNQRNTYDRIFFQPNSFYSILICWTGSYQNYRYYNKKQAIFLFSFICFPLFLYFYTLTVPRESCSAITAIHTFYCKLLVVVQTGPTHKKSCLRWAIYISIYHRFNIYIS